LCVGHSAAVQLLRAVLMANLSLADLSSLYKRLALSVHVDKCFSTYHKRMVATAQMQALVVLAKQVLPLGGPPN
jgi:hypothetical protein